MRRASAVALVVLLALPGGSLSSAPGPGIITGVVRLAGQAKSGVTVAFIDLQSGAVVRATTNEKGSFKANAPPGEYAVTTESQAGLAVKQAPLRVGVVAGKEASADVELAAVPQAVLQAPTPPPATEPPAGAPAAEGQPPATEPRAPATPSFAETTGSGAQIQFKPVTCFLAGEFPLLDAKIEPASSVARARIYFRGAKGTFYYYVEMNQEADRYVGKLPRPRVEASPITYYIQSTTTDFEESQTREIEAAVVEKKEDCGDREMAAFGPPGPVTVFSASTGAVGSPMGFAAAGAAGIAVGVITIIAASAATAGIVGGVVPGPGTTGPTPPPIIVNPTPIPTPFPIPQPTPTPITISQ